MFLNFRRNNKFVTIFKEAMYRTVTNDGFQSRKRTRSSFSASNRKTDNRSVQKKRAWSQAGLRAKVKALVKDMSEKKIATFQRNSGTVGAYNYGGFSNQIIPLTPFGGFCQIDQGVSQTQRIGNKVKIASSTFRAIMYPTMYHATSNPNPSPSMVRFVVFSLKGETNVLPTTLDNFFQNGSTSHAPNSDMGDMIDEINRDEYTVYRDFTVKMGYAKNDRGGVDDQRAAFANNDFKLVQRIDLDVTKYCPASVVFNDNLSTPNSRAVYVVWFSCEVTGLSADTNRLPALMHMTAVCKYTDA